MGKEFYEIAYIIPYIAKSFNSVRDFLKSARSNFPLEDLPEIQLYNWIGSGSLGVVFRFRFGSFIPSMLQWFNPWIKDLEIDVIELESFNIKEREGILKKFDLTSDAKFTGNYDLNRALEAIKGRASPIKSVRKEQRLAARLKVRFKSAQEFVDEYTENISFGGMFIQGKTDISLKSRIEVILVLPDSDKEVKAIAEVVHIVTDEMVGLLSGDRVPGFGVQFIEILDDGEKLIREYVKGLAKRPKSQSN